MKKRSLLIAGGGHAEIPLIRAARALGFYVVTTGNRENDLGHKYADRYIKADFSDKEAIRKLTSDLKVDALCPCANDFSALSCAYTAEKIGLNGHDSHNIAEIIHLKDRFREFANKHGISSPKAGSFNDTETALNALHEYTLPVIVKPVDLSGGKGIARINEPAEAKSLIEKAFSISRAKRVVIEEFIEGSNHGFSSFIRNQKVVFYFWDNEHYFLNKYMVSGATCPGDVPDSALGVLIRETEQTAAILNLKDGIFHIQFVLKGETPYIIEICRRPPGDLYIDFVKHATGVDYPMHIIKSFAGMGIDDLEQTEPLGFFTRHCVMAHQKGLVKNIVFDGSIQKNIIESLMWWKEGDKVDDLMTAKFGIVFLKYDSKKEMMDKSNRLHELIKVEVV